MAKTKENIAVTNAMYQTATGMTDPLSPEQHRAVRSYVAAMSIFKKMLQDKLISAEEYRKIDTIIAKKYNSYLCDLYR